MKKEYLITRASEEAVDTEGFWDGIPKLSIDFFRDTGNGYKPRTEAAVVHTEKGFHVYFKVYEDSVTVRYHNMNEPVYKDSCVEFFLNPKAGSDERYLNFEINAIGTLLLQFGVSRNDRFFVTDVSPEVFAIKSLLNAETAKNFSGPFWTVRYFIPFSFLEKCYGKLDLKPGYRFEGNFYKCGDETKFPHYGMWNPIMGGKLSFHTPEYFGTLIME